MSSVIRKEVLFEYTREAQDSFDDVKQALMNATALLLPTSERKIVLEIDSSAVEISRTLNQEEQWNGRTGLQSDCYGSHASNPTQMSTEY